MKKKITIKEATLRNFFSYGNQPQTFDFSKGTINLVKGSMGKGKSSLFSIIPFVLHGKTDRRLPAHKIINSINRKNLENSLSFEINGKEIYIKRGLSPAQNEILVDGSNRKIVSFQEEILNLVPIPLDLLFRILYLKTKTSESFYTISKGQREKFLEVFIDFNLIQKMKELNAQEIQLITHSNSKDGGKIEVLEEQQKRILSEIEELDSVNLQEQKKELQNNLFTDLELLNKLKKKLEIESEKEKKIQKQIQTIDDYLEEITENVLSQLKKQISQLKYAIKNIENEIGKIKSLNIESESCQEEIDKKILVRLNNQIVVKNKEFIETEKKYEKKSEKSKLFVKEIHNLNAKLGKVFEITSQIQKFNEIVQKKNSKLSEINIILSKDQQTSQNLEIQLKEIREQLQILLSARVISDRKLQITSLSKTILNTRIKPFLLDKIYPFLEKRINFYLGEFCFPVVINLSQETEAVFRSPGKPSFLYGNFSDGERRIIDLSTMFSFKDLLEAQIGVEINALIFDEYIANLPLRELETIVPKIAQIAEERQWNVFLSSHNPNLQNVISFDNVYNIEKIDNFSKISKV